MTVKWSQVYFTEKIPDVRHVWCWRQSEPNPTHDSSEGWQTLTRESCLIPSFLVIYVSHSPLRETSGDLTESQGTSTLKLRLLKPYRVSRFTHTVTTAERPTVSYKYSHKPCGPLSHESLKAANSSLLSDWGHMTIQWGKWRLVDP